MVGIVDEALRQGGDDAYVESFKTKRKDSKEYLEALDFLKNYFEDGNKKEIDL